MGGCNFGVDPILCNIRNEASLLSKSVYFETMNGEGAIP